MIDSTAVADVEKGINLVQAAVVAVSSLVSFIIGFFARRKK